MMAKIAIFGSSYVSRLGRYCNFDLKIPGIVRFFGQGGMKACDAIDSRKFSQLLDFSPDVVFMVIGGNDVSDTSIPSDIFKSIMEIISTLYSSGVKRVFISEIIERGNFEKAPGLTRERFNKQRKVINKKLKTACRDNFVMMKVKFPKDYDENDFVHLNCDGLRAYFFRVRIILCSVKL
ncbi:hypothetical protein FSP39_018796 [Pinctada imbricata]|uniref:SGNH hydrolase-type esterase domain-containing protein n=1 Tax=Pinctada imbricata TaxID=66713 RepID=A0AA88Y4S8_PINIB|nr:hypothetical protein FSP39_004156 [Pinctada imbricata]KAK3091305.1 hypothetical protein FSP39_018796 [Pinctada imbricata]